MTLIATSTQPRARNFERAGARRMRLLARRHEREGADWKRRPSAGPRPGGRRRAGRPRPRASHGTAGRGAGARSRSAPPARRSPVQRLPAGLPRCGPRRRPRPRGPPARDSALSRRPGRRPLHSSGRRRDAPRRRDGGLPPGPAASARAPAESCHPAAGLTHRPPRRREGGRRPRAEQEGGAGRSGAGWAEGSGRGGEQGERETLIAFLLRARTEQTEPRISSRPTAAPSAPRIKSVTRKQSEGTTAHEASRRQSSDVLPPEVVGKLSAGSLITAMLRWTRHAAKQEGILQ